MNVRAFVLAAVAALVALMVVGLLWYLPLDGLYSSWESGLARESTMDALEVVSMAVQALALAYLLGLVHRGGSFVMDGIRVGLVLGVFAISYPITIYASWNVSGAEMVAESIWPLVSLGIAGAAAGWTYDRLEGSPGATPTGEPSGAAT